MRISGVRTTSLFDGYGINYVIFFQGCSHHCDGCHNPDSWSFNDGFEVTPEEIIKSIEPYIGFISGVTFSGGDPVYQLDDVVKIAEWAKTKGLQTTLYTGFYFDELKCIVLGGSELDNIDYIIDGRFIADMKSDKLPFRGSLNQGIFKRVGFREWEMV